MFWTFLAYVSLTSNQARNVCFLFLWFHVLTSLLLMQVQPFDWTNFMPASLLSIGQVHCQQTCFDWATLAPSNMGFRLGNMFVSIHMLRLGNIDSFEHGLSIGKDVCFDPHASIGKHCFLRTRDFDWEIYLFRSKIRLGMSLFEHWTFCVLAWSHKV